MFGSFLVVCGCLGESKDILVVAHTSNLTSPMQSAKYIAAGSKLQPEWRHFGLNIPYYTHFTSPIRRYADVCVHRLLEETIDYTTDLDNLVDQRNAHELQLQAEICNTKNENAKTASRDSDHLYLSLMVKDAEASNRNLYSDAVVVDMGPNSFKVLLLEYGEEVMVQPGRDWKCYKTRVVCFNGKSIEGGNHKVCCGGNKRWFGYILDVDIW